MVVHAVDDLVHHVVEGGLELALACDFIYASDNASFGLVEAKLGLIPGFGGVARLCRRVGEARAKEMKGDEKMLVTPISKDNIAGQTVRQRLGFFERLKQ